MNATFIDKKRESIRGEESSDSFEVYFYQIVAQIAFSGHFTVLKTTRTVISQTIKDI